MSEQDKFAALLDINSLRAEYDELSKKHELLFGYINNQDSGYRELEDDERETLLRQSWAMADYLGVLRLRIGVEV